MMREVEETWPMILVGAESCRSRQKDVSEHMQERRIEHVRIRLNPSLPYCCACCCTHPYIPGHDHVPLPIGSNGLISQLHVTLRAGIVTMNGRSTPPLSNQQKRHSRNPSHLAALKKVQINGAPSRSNENVFASLRATQLVESKPLLPAELLASILDYLPVPDLVKFARVSRRLQEMVYDDTRWVQKLKKMGVWNEGEARKRVEEGMIRKSEKERKDEGRTLFDAGVEEAQRQSPMKRAADGFDDLTIQGEKWDKDAALGVFNRVKSIRGHARQEFGKIYAALAPIYLDLSHSTGHSDALIFRTYRDPEQQAQILANLKRFSQCDASSGCVEREQRLDGMIQVFENAVMREFEQGCVAGDVNGRVNRYAHVLVTLNGGAAAVESMITNHPLLNNTKQLGNPLDCLQDVAPGHVDLNPSQRFFEKVAEMMVQQADIVDRSFPSSVDVLTPLWERVCNETISDYLTTLFDEAHSTGPESYVKAVAGTFGQALRLLASLKPTKASPEDFPSKSKQTLIHCFSKHFDLYLTEEYQFFRSRAESDVSQWEKELSEQEASTESYFMSNVNRQAAKRDFLSSFKKVVMMPVNVFPISSPFAGSKAAKSTANMNAVDTAYTGSRTDTPRTATPLQEAPTTELAAKAAIMNSKLEGIKSLFSIEIALNLTHLAKASLERAALMVQIGGEQGTAAQKECRKIFVTMLDILGTRHIKSGFDKAVTHLGAYNPREVRPTSSLTTAGQSGVEPLVTFLELVNIGDLIQQMIEVFYTQELLFPQLSERDDFLDPAVKGKKKFEQMLDERVAAGLSKGIDVLMDEVEYICSTTQLPTDFNPAGVVADVGPSATAKKVVEVVGGHTGMLVGSTDKNMLDVFNQEVGLRLFGALCKHFKRQRISVEGAMRFISDINHYAAFVGTLRQKQLAPYFEALREMSQIYLVHIDPPAGGTYFGSGRNAGGAAGSRASVVAAAEKSNRSSWLGGSSSVSATSQQAKELATIVADSTRYQGIFSAEEVYEFVERRADWFLVKGEVDRGMFGQGCVVM